MRITSHALVFAATLYGSIAGPSVSMAESAGNLHLPPEDGGPRRLEIVRDGAVLFAEPSEDAAVTAALSRGTVLANLGCRDIEKHSWCELRPLRSRTNGFVQMEMLKPARGPDGTVPMGSDDSEDRVRQRSFDVQTDIACAQERGQSLGGCKAASAQSGGGDATIIVTFSNGFARNLYFTNGEFMRANSTMSGVGTDIDWRLENNVYSIRVDDQRFEVPKEMVVGR